jgi:hypothetical protein
MATVANTEVAGVVSEVAAILSRNCWKRNSADKIIIFGEGVAHESLTCPVANQIYLLYLCYQTLSLMPSIVD